MLFVLCHNYVDDQLSSIVILSEYMYMYVYVTGTLTYSVLHVCWSHVCAG